MKLLWYLGIIWILCSNASSKTDNKSIGVTVVQTLNYFAQYLMFGIYDAGELLA